MQRGHVFVCIPAHDIHSPSVHLPVEVCGGGILLSSLPRKSWNGPGLKYLEDGTLRDRFNAYDVDGSGAIDANEAVQLLIDAGATDSDATPATRSR